MSNPTITLHVGWINLSVEFMKRYVKNLKFCSLYWNEGKRVLSIAFFSDDSEVAKRYTINKGSNPGNIPCATFLRDLNLPRSIYKSYDKFDVDIVRDNIVFNIQL